MISARGVRHFRHCMFFTALKNPFYTSFLVDFFVLGTYFSRRTIDNDVSDRKEIAQSTFTIISRRLKGCNFVVCVVCAIQWVTLSNGEVASERGLVLVTPMISMSSCASIASATRFPIVPYPLIATLTTILLKHLAWLNIHKQFVRRQ